MKKMKKQVKILISVAILLIIAGITVLAATIGKVNSSYVRLREKASTESEILDVLMEGEQVEILAEEGDWYKISVNGRTGYVSKAFVTKNGETPAPAADPNANQNTANNATPETPAAPATTTATITTKIYKVAENSSVYILPILSSDVIGTINAGEGLDLINSTGLWGYVKSGNIKGWVRIDKLSSEEVTQTVEVPVEQPATEQPAEEKPTEQPAAEQPAEEKPAEQPAAEQPTEQPATEQVAQPEQSNYAEKTMYVSAIAINIRKEASITSDVISGATLNTAYTVVGEENDWYKVKAEGGYGYIKKELLSDTKTEETSRSNQTDRTQAAQAQTPAATPAPAPAAQTQAAPAATPAPAASTSKVTGADVAAYAQQFLGCSYVYAAAGPNSFDCSGLTMYVYKHFGYNLSHSSKVQATQGVKVTGDLQPGDILVFSNDGKQVGHVGLYIGNDKFIHASDYSTGVIISNLHDSWNINKYWGARRIIQ